MKPTQCTQQGLSKENLNVTNKKKQTSYLPSYIDNTGAWGRGAKGVRWGDFGKMITMRFFFLI
jgi:hypothetical protein